MIYAKTYLKNKKLIKREIKKSIRKKEIIEITLKMEDGSYIGINELLSKVNHIINQLPKKEQRTYKIIFYSLTINNIYINKRCLELFNKLSNLDITEKLSVFDIARQIKSKG